MDEEISTISQRNQSEVSNSPTKDGLQRMYNRKIRDPKLRIGFSSMTVVLKPLDDSQEMSMFRRKDESILECIQNYHSDKSTKKKSPDWCSSGNDCSPLLYSEEDSEHCLLDESKSTSYCERSTDQQVTLLDSSSIPCRSYKVPVNCLTSMPESEESEIPHTSQAVLLQISSSSSNDSDSDIEKQSTGCGACAEIASNSSTEWESSCSESKSVENTRNTACKFTPSYTQVYEDGPSLSYEYANVSMDVIQAVQNIRIPVEIKQWAIEYLNKTDISRLYPRKRKKLQ